MKWIPFSNSRVSLPKIAQHCCPFSITRLLSHCMNARASAAFFFLLYKSEKPEVTISNKKPLELLSHYRK
ncbi:ADE_G0027400.mRNA.1.CDS.1 [Saccharomyces cerevisiae]|nr:ADE_G0027400.mRNA.1.CDS.1 [Saccharomyces cerevisiae]CAI6610576.1 ADE_G0027400.mRNA.1.CDS.1 [Saccharomyces cerevisiae]